MSQYASTIAAMEADLQSLDIRRAQLIAAIGAVRVLEGGRAPAPVVQPAKTAEKRTDGRSKPRANRPAVRSLPDDAATTDRIIAALDASRADASRPSAATPPIAKSVSENSTQLETVWDGRKGSKSLTGAAGGLGSTLSGITHAVVRSR